MAKSAIIHINNLTKSFGDFKALDGLSLEIQEGTIYGLIGPNGAGKTTVINILLGILDPDKGSEIRIMGKEIPKEVESVYKDIGFMPQDLALYEEITIKQNLEFFGKLFGLSKKNGELRKRITEVLKLVNLNEFEDRVIQDCSGGMKRRASLAVALLHNPKILILDEPTVGVDPELRIEFWKYFRKMADNGTTILITTHYLAESVNCDVVGLIFKRVVEADSPQNLRERVMKAQNLNELPNMEHVFVHFTRQKKVDPEEI